MSNLNNIQLSLKKESVVENMRLEFFYHILNWDPYWLQDKQYKDIPPAVINDIQMTAGRLNYTNVEEYQNIMFPKLIHEYWFTLKSDYKEFLKEKGHKITYAKQCNEASYDIKPVDSKKDRKLFSFCLETRTYKRCCFERAKMNCPHPRAGDLITLQSTQSRKNSVVFAYIKDLEIRDGKDEHRNSICILKYYLLTNISLKWTVVSGFVLTTITFLLGYLSLIDALELLQKLPLHKSILRPDIETYQMPSHIKFDLSDIATKDVPNAMQLHVISGVAGVIEQAKPKICLVQGPPGTGKSKTIVNLIASMVKKNDKIRFLVCAPSNKAIDSVVLRLLDIQTELEEQGTIFNVVRVGRESKMDNLVKKISLSNIEKDKERLQKLSIKNKIGSHTTFQHIILNSHVITSTLISCYTSRVIKSLYSLGPFGETPPICIVDEAAQATELLNMVPFLLGVKIIILVGDPQQLRPIVLSERARNLGYDTSLFARTQKLFEDDDACPIVMLDTQYRMTESISLWPNKYFYGGALKDAASVNPLGICNYILFNHDFAQDKDGHSNIKEAELVIKLIEFLRKKLNLKKSSKITIGVITPYHEQRKLITKMLQSQVKKSQIELQKSNNETKKLDKKSVMKIEKILNNSNKNLQHKNSAESNFSCCEEKTEEKLMAVEQQLMNLQVNSQEAGKSENNSKDNDNDDKNNNPNDNNNDDSDNNNDNDDGDGDNDDDDNDNDESDGDNVDKNHDENDEKIRQEFAKKVMEQLGTDSKNQESGNYDENKDPTNVVSDLKYELDVSLTKNDDANICTIVKNSSNAIIPLMSIKICNDFIKSSNSMLVEQENEKLSSSTELVKKLSEKSEEKSEQQTKNRRWSMKRNSCRNVRNQEKRKSKQGPKKVKVIEEDKTIEINTVDSFQGSERDIIILPCVRSSGIGFTKDPNRLCVSLTRAKHSLIMLGNFKAFAENDMWISLINDAAERNSFVNINDSDAELIFNEKIIQKLPEE